MVVPAGPVAKQEQQRGPSELSGLREIASLRQRLQLWEGGKDWADSQWAFSERQSSIELDPTAVAQCAKLDSDDHM